MKRAQHAWLAGCLLAALIVSPVLAEQMTAKVLSIADGDTITVIDQHQQVHRIRLEGIDAPEREQGYGRVSRQHLARLLSERTVQIEFYKRDRYGRLVGRVILQRQDIGLRQIEAGLAWHYTAYASEQSPQNRESYASAEARAREEKRGLWAESAPMPPWIYRRRLKERPFNPAAERPKASSASPP